MHFSNFYYTFLANLLSVKSKVAVAAITVQTKDGPVSLEAMVDTGGAVSIATDICSAIYNPPGSEATHRVHSPRRTSFRRRCWTTNRHTLLRSARPRARAQRLRVNNMECDINHHAKASGSIGAVPLKRTSSKPYHYADSISKVHTKPDTCTLSTPTHAI